MIINCMSSILRERERERERGVKMKWTAKERGDRESY